MHYLHLTIDMVLEIEDTTSQLAAAVAKRWPPAVVEGRRWMQRHFEGEDLTESVIDVYSYDPSKLEEITRYAIDAVFCLELSEAGIDYIESIQGLNVVDDTFSILK